MQWETMTPWQEVPKFVFNEGQSSGEHQGEVKPDKVEAAQGPMLILYKEEVGWVAECLGPTSGHYKQKAREVQPKNLKEQPSPSEVKPIIQSQVKHESPVPLQQLESNVIEVKCNKGCKESRALGKENTTMDGGVATTAMQCRQAQ